MFIIIGIGGSYLGARAAIELLADKKKPGDFYAGTNLSSSYHSNLLKLIKNKRVSVDVISKSGTTTEPAIAFRIIKNNGR